MQSVYVASGMINGIATWSPSPSANDTVEGPITPATIVCDNGTMSVMSGDTFPVGTTTVTCRANDTALNEGSCQFDVVVQGIVFLY